MGLKIISLERLTTFLNKCGETFASKTHTHTKDDIKTALGYIPAQSISEEESLIKVAVPALGWEGTSAPYTQTINVEGVHETDNPILVSVLEYNASPDVQKTYSKIFGILSSGVGVTNEGSISFSVYEKPEADITIGLKVTATPNVDDNIITDIQNSVTVCQTAKTDAEKAKDTATEQANIATEKANEIISSATSVAENTKIVTDKTGTVTQKYNEIVTIGNTVTEKSDDVSKNATLAKRYAVGGVVSEDAQDNAKYYYEQVSEIKNKLDTTAKLVIPDFYVDFETGELMSTTKSSGINFWIEDGVFYGETIKEEV